MKKYLPSRKSSSSFVAVEHIIRSAAPTPGRSMLRPYEDVWLAKV